MKIGIIYYSYSGFTFYVSKKITKNLRSNGYEVGMEKLEPAGKLDVRALRTELKSLPRIEEYDKLVIASPVHGGRIASPMAEFLEKTASMDNKAVVCLVTHFLPYSTGGEQTMRLLKSACEAKGGQFIGSENIPTLCLSPRAKIERIMDMLEGAG